MSKMGLATEAEKYFNYFRQYAEYDISIYKNLNLAMVHVFDGDNQKAIEHMKLFTEQENYHYWTILFFEIDPMMDEIKTDPEFMKIFKDIESKFWNNHKQIKASLEEKGLL
jgi:hypothetical protein